MPYSFLFTELVKRDFKKKYKRTYLGVVWSLLAPMLHLLVLALVFTQFFGKEIEHYIIYLFAGNLIFFYFKESTYGGMQALKDNSHIIKSIKVPDFIFIISKNASSFATFTLTLVIFFIFSAIDGITFSFAFLTLIYPIICLFLFCTGIGLILSVLYVYFMDIKYLYDIFTLILMYLSAIFYTTDVFSEGVQGLFLLNPVYVYILYFRTVVLQNTVPAFDLHLISALYAVLAITAGYFLYRKYNQELVDYM